MALRHSGSRSEADLSAFTASTTICRTSGLRQPQTFIIPRTPRGPDGGSQKARAATLKPRSARATASLVLATQTPSPCPTRDRKVSNNLSPAAGPAIASRAWSSSPCVSTAIAFRVRSGSSSASRSAILSASAYASSNDGGDFSTGSSSGTACFGGSGGRFGAVGAVAGVDGVFFSSLATARGLGLAVGADPHDDPHGQAAAPHQQKREQDEEAGVAVVVSGPPPPDQSVEVAAHGPPSRSKVSGSVPRRGRRCKLYGPTGRPTPRYPRGGCVSSTTTGVAAAPSLRPR